MSGTFEHYQRYNNIVELISGKSADEYPALKLILHVMEQQFENHGGLPFKGTVDFPETDANNIFPTDSNNSESNGSPNTVSKYWVDALNDFANFPSTTKREIKQMKASYAKIQQNGENKNFALKLVSAMYNFYPSSRMFTGGSSRSSSSNPVPTSSGSAIDFLNTDDKARVEGKNRKNITEDLKLQDIYTDKAKEKIMTVKAKKADISHNTPLGTKFYEERKMIPFYVDKYLLTKLLDGAYTGAVSSSKYSEEFFNSTKGVSTGVVSDDADLIFYRRLGEPNKLYTKRNGREINIEKGSKEFLSLTANNNCFTSGYTGNTSGQTCADLVEKCLLGKPDDINKCKDFMASSNWNDAVVNENVSPPIALDLLRKFGFNTKTVQVNEVGKNLIMIQEVDEWVDRLKKNFTGNGSNQLSEDEVKAISTNNALTAYLKKLVALINSNPGILNKDYVGKSQLNENPTAFANTQLGKYGLLPKRFVTASGVPSMSSVLSLQNAVMNNRNQVSIRWGIMPQGLIFQTGGGMSSGIAEVLQKAQDNSSFPLKLSKLLEESFNSFVASLLANGKDLDNGDKNHINELIGKLKDTENKLFKAAIYTDKYIRLISVFGENDETKVISMNHAKQFVDKRNGYFDKVGKKQDQIFSIIKALSTAHEKETKQETKSVTDYPAF